MKMVIVASCCYKGGLLGQRNVEAIQELFSLIKVVQLLLERGIDFDLAYLFLRTSYVPGVYTKEVSCDNLVLIKGEFYIRNRLANFLIQILVIIFVFKENSFASVLPQILYNGNSFGSSITNHVVVEGRELGYVQGLGNLKHVVRLYVYQGKSLLISLQVPMENIDCVAAKEKLSVY